SERRRVDAEQADLARFPSGRITRGRTQLGFDDLLQSQGNGLLRIAAGVEESAGGVDGVGEFIRHFGAWRVLIARDEGHGVADAGERADPRKESEKGRGDAEAELQPFALLHEAS